MTKLEWHDSLLNDREGAQFHAISKPEDADMDREEQTWHVCEDYNDGLWYLTNDWMMENLRIGDGYDTLDEVKALAQKLQDVLDTPKGDQE